jgi:hypothetical protein
MQFFESGIGFLFPDDKGASFLSELLEEFSEFKPSPRYGSLWSLQLPFEEIYEICIDGRTIDFISMIENFGLITLRVGLCDGERLYRELYCHYPSAISEWIDQLQQNSSFDESTRNNTNKNGS